MTLGISPRWLKIMRKFSMTLRKDLVKLLDLAIVFLEALHPILGAAIVFFTALGIPE
jgi:hypothetical protein